MKELSPGAASILAEMRKSGESRSIDAQGREWMSIYLDNVRPAGMSAHQFAGYLSALEAAGVYKPLDGYAFGDVLVA